ncbi:chorismate mutase [Enterococcus cecorum]|nr:chorismate mutase [Enterococcus cecorum]
MRTEKEKMIAGESYFSGDAELVADRKHARKMMRAINQETDGKKRSELLKQTFGKTVQNLYMEPNVHFDYGYNISVGENFYANFNAVLLDICPITIGDNCMLAPNVQLYTAYHPLDPIERNSGYENGAPITIGDNVWIGGNSVILPGVTLGDNVVVGSGSVVTKSFPDNVVIAGNPAKILKEIPKKVEESAENLESLRKTIDQIDRQIVKLLEERMDVVSAIADYKAKQKLPVLDENREKALLEKVSKLVYKEEYQATIRESFDDLMKHSRNYQMQRMEGKDND